MKAEPGKFAATRATGKPKPVTEEKPEGHRVKGEWL